MTFTLGAVAHPETVALAGARARLRGADATNEDVQNAAADRAYMQSVGHDIGAADVAVGDPMAVAVLYDATVSRRGLKTPRTRTGDMRYPMVQSQSEETVHILRERGFGVVPWSGAR